MNNRHADCIEALKSITPIAAGPGTAVYVALRDQMRVHFITLLESEERCRRDRGIESLRISRQALSRLRTLVDLMEKSFKQPTAPKARKRMRQLSDRLEAIHELDVMMRDILHYGAGLAQRMTIASIVAHLDAQRLLAREDFIAYLDSKKYRKFLNRFKRYLLQPDEKAFRANARNPRKPHQLGHVLPALLHKQLSTIRAYDPFVGDTDSEILISLREDVQHFHYLISCFEPMLGETTAPYLVDLTRIEDLLERISEASRTLYRLIHLPRTNLGKEQLQALKDYRRDLRTRRQKLYDQLPALWEDFNVRRTQENLTQSLLVLL